MEAENINNGERYSRRTFLKWAGGSLQIAAYLAFGTSNIYSLLELFNTRRVEEANLQIDEIIPDWDVLNPENKQLQNLSLPSRISISMDFERGLLTPDKVIELLNDIQLLYLLFYKSNNQESSDSWLLRHVRLQLTKLLQYLHLVTYENDAGSQLKNTLVLVAFHCLEAFRKTFPNMIPYKGELVINDFPEKEFTTWMGDVQPRIKEYESPNDDVHYNIFRNNIIVFHREELLSEPIEMLIDSDVKAKYITDNVQLFPDFNPEIHSSIVLAPESAKESFGFPEGKCVVYVGNHSSENYLGAYADVRSAMNINDLVEHEIKPNWHLYKQAGDSWGVDPALVASIVVQEMCDVKTTADPGYFFQVSKKIQFQIESNDQVREAVRIYLETFGKDDVKERVKNHYSMYISGEMGPSTYYSNLASSLVLNFGPLSENTIDLIGVILGEGTSIGHSQINTAVNRDSIVIGSRISRGGERNLFWDIISALNINSAPNYINSAALHLRRSINTNCDPLYRVFFPFMDEKLGGFYDPITGPFKKHSLAHRYGGSQYSSIKFNPVAFLGQQYTEEMWNSAAFRDRSLLNNQRSVNSPVYWQYQNILDGGWGDSVDGWYVFIKQMQDEGILS